MSINPDYSPTVRDRGISYKTIFDCAEPYALEDRFVHALLHLNFLTEIAAQKSRCSNEKGPL